MIDRRHPGLWLVLGTILATTPARADNLADRFRSPPDGARPWVYWMVMDGNFGPGGITEDLEAMKRVGIGGLIFMEVDVGIPCVQGGGKHPVGLLDEAFEIALVTRRTVYDCLYIALAERLGSVVVTADQKLYNATRGGPYAPRVHWVGDRL